MLDVDEDVHWEDDEDVDEEGVCVGAMDIIGFDDLVDIMSEDVWNVFPDTSTIVWQGLREGSECKYI